jgi:hypothetical protein
LELHPRLTVIASPDHQRRLEAYGRITAAMHGTSGSHLEVKTETGEAVVALRSADQAPSLIDPLRQQAFHPDEQVRLGIAGQLNDSTAMERHMNVLHASKARLAQRAISDQHLIALAQTPIDQLWAIANSIQTDRETLEMTEEQETEFSAAAAERATREAEVSEVLAQKADTDRKHLVFSAAAGATLLLALYVILTMNPLYGAPLLLVGAGLAAFAAKLIRNKDLNSRHADIEEQFGGSVLGVQLGRVDELFDNHSLARRQTEARANLARSEKIWHELAGDADPEILIRERQRLEELAGHLRIVDNELVEVTNTEDKDLLVGFASLLAELTRRFPVERVPLFVDDIFSELTPEYHSALRELIIRASHKRQVVLESADFETAQWAAAEAIGGNGILITDQDVTPLEASAAAGAEPAL